MPFRLIAAALLALALLPADVYAQNPIRWSITRASDATVVAGKNVDVHVTAQIEDGWHLYATSVPPGGPVATVISVAPGGPFSLGGVIDEPLPKREFDPNFNIETPFHEEKVTFGIPVRVAPGTASRKHVLRIVVNFQTCNDRLCLPPKDEALDLALNIGGGADGDAPANAAPPAPPTGSPPTGATAPINKDGAPPPAAGSTPPAGATTTAVSASRAPVVDLAASSRASTLAAYIWLAAAMGGLSLLTPCVFPMVPITVSYFTNRARRSRREAVTQSIVYGVGIILTFTAVGFTLAIAFGASGLNRFAADPWLNLGVTALFIAFALSLFGIYELALPSRLVTMAAKADAGHGRFVGTLLMGLAFTLTSFTCTAPFLGTLLVVASQGDWQWPLAGMLAFSTIFALPFVVLAFAPQLIASLPRSGSWLIAVKATMGLLELAAAMKFLSNADLVWGWGIFTREVVLISWIVIAIVLVVYLAGMMKLGHAPRLSRPRFARSAAVVASAVVGIWLTTGLWGRRLGELEAFLPPADLAAKTPGGELPWILNDYDAALAEAARQNRPLLIDFTGYTCTNCRWMEANMFPRHEVERELARYVRVRLYTDGRGELYRRFQQMEQTMFGTVALPYYAALAPDGTPKVAFGGLTRNADEFVAFLRHGLN